MFHILINRSQNCEATPLRSPGHLRHRRRLRRHHVFGNGGTDLGWLKDLGIFDLPDTSAGAPWAGIHTFPQTFAAEADRKHCQGPVAPEKHISLVEDDSPGRVEFDCLGWDIRGVRCGAAAAADDQKPVVAGRYSVVEEVDC